jgi:hypothetical protein
LAIYNCHDTVNTARLVMVMQQELRDCGQWDHHRQWFDTMVPIVIDMQLRGTGQLDKDARVLCRDEYKAKLKDIEGGIKVHWPADHNYTKKFFGSNVQKPHFLFDVLGLKSAPKAKGRSRHRRPRADQSAA